MNKIITAALACAGISVSVTAALPPTLTPTVTYRDFTTRALINPLYYNPNFEKPGPISGLETGIVKDTLSGVGAPPTFWSVPVAAPPPVSGGPSSVTTAADFNEWWSPTVDGALGNAPITSSLTLTLESSTPCKWYGTGADAIYAEVGIYHFVDLTFFPIDGPVGSNPAAPTTAGGFWGNEGRTHNYGFTMESHTTFTYFTGFTFNYQGDDDLWVFLDGKLALDLGGVHPPLPGVINDASLAGDGIVLVEGQEYTFDLFYAERHTNASTLEFDISLLRECVPEANAFGPSLLLLTGIGSMVVRRRQKAA